MRIGVRNRTLFVALLLLVACTKGGNRAPADVLRDAATNAQTLQSAAFVAIFSYVGESAEGSMSIGGSMEGSIGQGGRQIMFDTRADITMPTMGAGQSLTVEADVVVPAEEETYLRIRRADGSMLFLPGIGLLPTELVGKWFSVGTPGEGDGIVVTPDPSLLTLQTQAVRVTNDRSYEDIDERSCYVYDVELDREAAFLFLKRVAEERDQPFDDKAAEDFLRSIEAVGTIWIDSESLVVRRIEWQIDSVGEAPEMHADISLHLSKHNEPVAILPPTGAVDLPSMTGSTLLF